MALSARELVLIMRARDEASRAIRNIGGSLQQLGNEGTTTAAKLQAVGTGMLTAGAVMASAGAVGVGFFNGATQDAINYNKQVALTLTQAGNVGTSLEELSTIGKDIGREVPVAFDSIQDSLFDVFSTVDTNVPNAQRAVESFGKAAVAGDANISSVSRTTLAALNAWNLPIQDTSRLLDVQFKLVEKGAGTYDQFSGSIGRAIPAAVAAGQEVEVLAGAMAFLTRNGLSTDQAATSAARAMELMADPKSTANLEEIGVAVKDAEGNFNSFDSIISQLATNAGWAAMTGPERKQAFNEVFGRGSIQARRFFDVAIPNWQQFNSLTDEMRDSSGAMDRAYDIMFEQPANQIQLMENRLAILRTEIGDRLIPVKLRLLQTVTRLLDWWDGLSESTQTLIVKIAAGVSAFLLIAGAIISAVGAVLLFVGIVAPAVGGVAALMKILLGANVAVLAFAAAAYLIYRNWDQVKAFLLPIFEAIKNGVLAFIEAFRSGESAGDGFVGWMSRLGAGARAAWETIKAIFFAAIEGLQAFYAAWNGDPPGGDGFVGFMSRAGEIARDTWEKIKTGAQLTWDALVALWNWTSSTFGPGLSQLWQTLQEEIPPIIREIGETVDWLLQAFNDFWAGAQIVWGAIGPYVIAVLEGIWAYVQFFINNFLAVWNAWGPEFLNIIQIAWDQAVAIIDFAIKFISNLIQLVMNIIQGDWREAWTNIQNIQSAAWNLIVATFTNGARLVGVILRGMWNMIVGVMSNTVSAMISGGQRAIRGYYNALVSFWGTIASWFLGMPGRIRGFFSGAGSWLRQAGRNILGGLIDGVRSRVGELQSSFSSITSSIPSWKGPPARDRVLLRDNGKLIMAGLQTGLESGYNDVRSYLTGLTNPVALQPGLAVRTVGTPANNQAPIDVLALTQAIKDALAEMPRNGLNVEGDVVLAGEDVIDELDWWAQKQASGI